MKKNYQQPAAMVVSVAAHGHILQASVTGVTTQQSVNIRYGGGSNNAARTKDVGEVYDVWDDDWSAE